MKGMAESMERLMRLLQSGFAGVGLDRRIQGVAVGLVAVALIWFATQWATSPIWVPAFTALDLESSGAVVAALDGERVEYRIERGGTEVRVRESDLARARVLVASEGLLPGGRPGLELFDRPAWGMTDFTERINYRRALEGELERTLSNMTSIRTAEVHIALPTTSFFAQAEPALEASVVLGLRRPGDAVADLVEGVQHLVSSSVFGLAPENVTVVSESGRVFSKSLGGGGGDLSGTGRASRRQFEMKRELEEYLEAKARDLIVQTVGEGNAEVSLSVDLDFDQVIRTTQTVAGEGGTEGAPAVTQGQGVRGVEQFTSASGAIRRLTVAVLVNNRPVRQSDGSVRMEQRSREELDEIESLLRNAIGVDENRGDAVTIASVVFARSAALPPSEPDGIDFMDIFEAGQRPVLWILAIGFALRVLSQVLAHLRIAPSRPQEQLAAGVPVSGALAPAMAAGHDSAGGALVVPDEVIIPTADEIARKRAAAQVIQEPQAAARVVRAWLKEA